MSLRPWAPLVVPPSLTGSVLDRLLTLLVGLDEDYLREHPDTPDLYKAGIPYKMEKPGEEKWLSIPWVRIQGWGDCEDLAAWRTAELRVKYRERAEAFWTSRRTRDGKLLYHIRVRRVGGRIEDPSAILGMGRDIAERYGDTHGIFEGDKS